MKKTLYILLLSLAFSLSGCNFLEAPPDGTYNEENLAEYPKLVRGFIDVAYGSMSKYHVDFQYSKGDCCTDNGVLRDESEYMRKMSHGQMEYAESYADLYMLWNNAYGGIYNANRFLKDNLGLRTRFFEDRYSDEVYKRTLQGDAYACRAWFHFMVLKMFGGVAENGQILGVPVMTEPVEGKDLDTYEVERATFDETCIQIIKDCDSALVYLPLANKDFLRETNETTVCTGAIRYRKFDRVSVTALKAFVYLLWASPSFCPDRAKAIDLYDKAAQCAYAVFQHKMTKEYYKNVEGGYDPYGSFNWTDSESPEILLNSAGLHLSVYERYVYPSGFEGDCTYSVSQELVDAYPDKYGYPIDHPRSCYDPAHPYDNRDPRFYSDIFYDGSQIIRGTTGKPMYTFEIADNGKDAIGQAGHTSPTGYYIKKFTYNNYNPHDPDVEDGFKCVWYLRTSQMLAIFAEAANQVAGPEDSSRYGMSAKEALAILRKKSTPDGMAGLGVNGDPYLDECAAAGKDAFDALVRNEWRIGFCFEGQRQVDLHRWGDMEHLNSPIHGVKITTGEDGTKTYEYPQVDYRNYPSLWYPIFYKEMRKSSKMLQNQGWEFYK